VLTELALTPFDAMPPWLGLTLVSILTGVVALLVVRWTTAQAAMQRARDQMMAALYEMRIFLDRPRRVFAAQGRMAVQTLKYVGITLPALFVLAAPLTALFVHLELRHGLQPLEPGEEVVVRFELAETAVGAPIRAEAKDGLTITAPLFVLDSEPAAFVRVRAERPGPAVLILHVGETATTKELLAGSGREPVSMERRAGLSRLWAMGIEGGLPADSPVQRAVVPYEARDGSWLGMPWWGFWLVVSVVAAFALRRPFGVVL
jgi:hypothetical protein